MFLRVLEDEARNARPNAARRAEFENSQLEVRLFNVGHGEAILVVFDGKKAWLVDGGVNSQTGNRLLGQRLVDYLQERDLILEAILPSHPHFDHAGAFETILVSRSRHIAAPILIYRSDDPTWKSNLGWRKRFRDAVERRGEGVEEIALRDAHREVNISDGVDAHLFAGSGEGPYTSLFLHLRYHDARLLFTGDAYCRYEIKLLAMFGEGEFRADVLKVTHHGSSSGTARSVLQVIRPGIGIASTGDDSGHRLERDTLGRLGVRLPRGRPGPRRVFETLVDGDIILRTDGRPYRGGFLYQVDFESPGRFAKGLGAKVMLLEDVDGDRTTSSHPACE